MIFVDKLQRYFEDEFNLSSIDSIKLKYSLEVIFNEISKLIFLLILFSILGFTTDFVYSGIALLSIRPFTGGLHLKSYAECFVFTVFFFSTSIFLKNNIILGSNSLILLLVFSFFITLLCAPITGPNRPIYSNRKLKKFKLIGLAIIMIHLIIAYLFINKHPYIINSAWVFVLQSVQLLIAKGVHIYEKEKFYNKEAQ